LLVAATAVLLGTGVGLLAVRPHHTGLLLAAHKASFVGWFALTAVHVLAHLRETAGLAWRDWHPRRTVAAPRGQAARRAAVVVSVVTGVGLGAALLPSAGPWTLHTSTTTSFARK
ncbi:MAG TPA: hypothetical protein VNE21_05310, partial [Mycobacteriales bacterium]|nr:hypothetical protein [Mycobacteriales bacterium]